MPTPIALQLYTVRDALAQDFNATARKVASLGYTGVETAGFPGTTPEAAARLFADLGLTVAGAHAPLPLGPDQNKTLDTMHALGCKRLVCAWLPPENFQSRDGVRRVCDRLHEANAVAHAHGLTLGYHNHDFEFSTIVEGRPAHAWMQAELDLSIFFELDVYWIKVAGVDPAHVVADLGPRAPLLHIKDGPATKQDPMTAVGAGGMDFGPILAAAHADWLIVELDHCATDMLEAVAVSYRNLEALER